MKTKLLFAMLGGLLASTAADAAVFTKSYTIVSTFTNAPVSSITTQVSITYDPADPSAYKINAFSIDDGISYASIVGGTNYYGNIREHFIGALNNAQYYAVNTNDFRLQIWNDPAGNATFAKLNFVRAGYRTAFMSTSDVITEVQATGAVPEPAAWAMMIGGFGLVGSAMRRRSGAALTA